MTDTALTLQRKLRIAERRRQLRSVAMISPLFGYLLFVFVLPILMVLGYSVDNPDVPRYMPRSAAAIDGWNGKGLPDEPVFAALVADLRHGYEDKTIARAATSLNHEIAGFRSLVISSARKSARLEGPPFKDALIALDARWGETETWVGFWRSAHRLTARYVLAAVDLDRDLDNNIKLVDENRRVYLDYLGRTFVISLSVTGICLLMGYPMAWLMAHASPRASRILFMMVLIPFWTSLLVRTAAWVILLQKEGTMNAGLMWLGITDEPLQLIFNRFGVYVAMVHVLLPFLVLPIYSVMKSIPVEHLKASASLGATPFATFRRVYLPQTLPGVAAGSLLVWVLALGFYITPALVGGPGDQMLSFLIADFAVKTANWNMAAALAVLLLLSVAVAYPVFSRLTGTSNLTVR